MIDAMVLSSTQEARARSRASPDDERAAILAPLRRLLGPYLGLEPGGPAR
ncbi:hypothetical protein GXB85_06105 [Cellulomonas sp. APG4]|nr:hypothetical protein [Cellulomonas sp. APG4]NCT90517.1 hypothetical protein [Cellulomonas sp. APG4]